MKEFIFHAEGLNFGRWYDAFLEKNCSFYVTNNFCNVAISFEDVFSSLDDRTLDSAQFTVEAMKHKTSSKT